MPALSVCICTFRRGHLATTLGSVVNQAGLAGTNVQIIVADNDRTASAKAMVADVNARLGSRVDYVHAPYNNISLARNTCLDRADGELVAFIDDDEIADPAWLRCMIDCLEQTGVDVVFGPVCAIYPPGTPLWLVRSSPHSLRPPRRKGAIITGYTANVLIRRAAIKGLRFDLDCGLTGGEDTDFFNRMHHAGATLGFCANGLVREEVAPARLSLRWLLRRAYRSGQSHARFVLKYGNGAIVLISGGKILLFVGMTVLSLWSAPRWRAYMQRAALQVGVLSWTLGCGIPRLYEAPD
jgi:succinoglycan biosynthesis protein ExoM